MRNRIIVLLTALMIFVSILPVGASTVTDSTDVQAVKLLTDLGIMDIDEYAGKFWDNTPVKRREIAQIICNLFAYEPVKEKSPIFNDVGEEYRGYVETVVRNGHMVGNGDGSFGASDYVTENQLLKIFVTILGGGTYAELQGGYPMGYVKIARRLGIIDNASVGEEPARRIDVAGIIYRTLEAELMQITGTDGETFTYSRQEGETFLTERRHIYRYDGIVNMIKTTSLDEEEGTGDDRVQIGNVTLIDSEQMAESYFGYNVAAYAYKENNADAGKIVSICTLQSNNTVVIDADDYVGVSGFEFSYYKGESVKTVKISSGCSMIYNGKATDYDPKKFDVTIGSIQLVDNDNDNRYDVALIEDYDVYVIDKASESAELISVKFDAPTINLENAFYSVTRDGVKDQLDKLSNGEVALIAISENTTGSKAIKIKSSTSRVVGTLETSYTRETGDYIKVEGEEYRISGYCKELAAAGRIPDIQVGDRGQFFLDAYGNVAYYNVNASGVSLGYMAKAHIAQDVFGVTIKVNIYNESGKFQELTAATKLQVNGSKVDLNNISSEIVKLFDSHDLVEYTYEDDILKSITFPKQNYDINEFSMDDSYEKNGAAFTCTSTSMLDHKYTVSGSTTVFNIPESAEERNQGINFSISTGANFIATHAYKLYLYDINIDGEARCAVRPMVSLNETWIGEDQLTMVVCGVGKMMNYEGIEVDSIFALDESGKEIERVARNNSVLEVDTASGTRKVKAGDVIQYRTDTNGELIRVHLVHDSEAVHEYYKPVPLEDGKSSYTIAKGYGQVMNAGSSKIVLHCGELPVETTPLDIGMVVPASGSAMYEYDSAKDKVTPITSGEIARGDSVFAVSNSKNVLKMLVIYK